MILFSAHYQRRRTATYTEYRMVQLNLVQRIYDTIKKHLSSSIDVWAVNVWNIKRKSNHIESNPIESNRIEANKIEFYKIESYNDILSLFL